MNSPDEKSSQRNELSLGGKGFIITDPVSMLSVLPEEERIKIVREHTIKSFEIENELKQKINDSKFANMEMNSMIDMVNSDTHGKLNFEQEFKTGTGKAKISTRTVQSTSIVTVLIIIGAILVLIAIVSH